MKMAVRVTVEVIVDATVDMSMEDVKATVKP
jgi:hypothetical protein